MLEYLLLMALVAFLVLSSFKSNGILDMTRQATNDYFSSGTRAIMGGYYNSGKPTFEKPAPVNGHWCAWSVCINDVRTRECACPRAAFGGKECPDEAIQACSGGPLVGICNASLGLVYDPSSPLICVCQAGYVWSDVDGKCVVCSSNGSCSAPAPACGTTTSGVDNCGTSCTRTGAACSCVYGAWSSCTGACPTGSQTRSRTSGPASCTDTTQSCSMSPCCGDGTCDPGETCASCVADCSATCPCVYSAWSSCTGTCPTGSQTRTLTSGPASCTALSQSCSMAPCCGDGTCDPGETCASCVADCLATCPCVYSAWSSCTGTCPTGSQTRSRTSGPASCTDTTQSCSMSPCCGDGTCDTGENCTTCPADCTCPGGVCFNDACCPPSCGSAECGGDGCGGPCGYGSNCPVAGDKCYLGACCTPNCTGTPCGDDHCGDPLGCGYCPGQTCNYFQQCVDNPCVPDMPPLNSSPCSLGGNGQPWTPVAMCSGQDCTFQCKAGFSWTGAACVPCSGECCSKLNGAPCSYDTGLPPGNFCIPVTCQNGHCGAPCANGATMTVNVGYYVNSTYCGCNAASPTGYWREYMSCVSGYWANTGGSCGPSCSPTCGMNCTVFCP
jgi:hypothetical protein